MAKCVKHAPCPRCRERGQDTRGDNLGIYDDGTVHCYACGYHPAPKVPLLKKETISGSEDKAVLPFDFSREVPTRAWKWLLQFGLSYSYWKPFVGWSEYYSRLILTVGSPTRFSIGRYIEGVVAEGNGVGADGNGLGRPPGSIAGVLEASLSGGPSTRKWRIWGDRGEYVEVLGGRSEGPVVLVEDLISAHKVAQVSTCIPLFGTKVLDSTMRTLVSLKRPVALWLDADQYPLLAPKINRLQTFLEAPVRYIHTDKDPKRYGITEIQDIVSA